MIATLASGVMSTLGQFTASITNSSNTLESGSVGLTETDTESNVCSAPGDGEWHECGSVDKFGGGNLASGASTTTTVTLRNTGASAAQLFLLPSPCRDTLTGAHGALCDQVTVEVACDGATVVTSTLNGFHDGRSPPTGYPVGTLAAGAETTCQFTLVAGPITDPGSVSQPISWRLTTGGVVT